jgi:hypothetical protein
MPHKRKDNSDPESEHDGVPAPTYVLLLLEYKVLYKNLKKNNHFVAFPALGMKMMRLLGAVTQVSRVNSLFIHLVAG